MDREFELKVTDVEIEFWEELRKLESLNLSN
jgi:hypothetical protein